MTADDKLVDEKGELKVLFERTGVPLVGTIIVVVEVVIDYKPGFWIT